MLISARDIHGRKVYLVDPLGVFLAKSSQIKLRILGQQRMKEFYLRIAILGRKKVLFSLRNVLMKMTSWRK